jgi:hypothetical protein
VDITDADLATHGPWPMRRAVFAELIDRSCSSSVKSVYIGAIFQEPGDPKDDTWLVEAAGNCRKLILAATPATLSSQETWLLKVIFGNVAYKPRRDGTVSQISVTPTASLPPAPFVLALHAIDGHVN